MPEKLALVACAFVVLIRAVASFFPEARLWGVNQLAYVSLVPRWIIIVLAFLILVPKVNRVCCHVLAAFFSQVEKSFRRMNTCYKYVFFSVASIIPFWVFRAKTHLLGDGSLRGSEILAGKEFSATAPLDFYVHVLIYRYLKVGAHQTYALLSCLAGGLFVFLALWLSHHLGKESKEKALALVILVSMGSVQLFFGYVESYSLAYTGIMAYFLLSLCFLESKCSFILPVLALFFSVSLHLSALYLLPSLIYLCVATSGTGERTFNLKRVFSMTAMLLLMGAGLLVLSIHNPDKTISSAYFISLFGSQEDPYSLFSAAHLVDVMNEQLLLSPVGIAIWAVVIFFAGKISFKDKVITFFMIVTLFSLVFAFMIDPKLGYARDWDLFCSTGLGYTVLGIYLGFNYLRRAEMRRLNYVILAIAFTALFSTLPWIYVNAHEDKAVERFKALLTVDAERSAYGHEILARYYRDKGLLNEEMEEWKKALAVLKNERYAGSLGNSYIKLGRYQEALAAFRMVVRINPNSALGYSKLGDVLALIGEYDDAEKHYQIAISKDTLFLEAYVNLGVMLSMTGDNEQALEVLKSAIQIDPDYFPAYDNISAVYYIIGRPKEVIPLFRAYLRRNPEDHQRIDELLRRMNIDLD
jgi:tetratricopeptide (TPR) repeat protein